VVFQINFQATSRTDGSIPSTNGEKLRTNGSISSTDDEKLSTDRSISSTAWSIPGTDRSVTSPLKPGINPTFRGIVVQVLIFGLKRVKKAFSARKLLLEIDFHKFSQKRVAFYEYIMVIYKPEEENDERRNQRMSILW
jgi:hypothetical protein